MELSSLCLVIFSGVLLAFVLAAMAYTPPPRPWRGVRRRGTLRKLPPAPQGRRKPEWVIRQVLRLSLHIPSGRQVAHVFNRLHGHRLTIGKTFVYQCRVQHAERLAAMHREIRRRVPRPLAPNHTWGLDLSSVPVSDGSRVNILGILDHGSRLCIRLQALPGKCTWILLGHLLIAIGQYGKPRSIRTDNEAMFTSRLWCTALRLLGIRHQRSAPGCPWQNGRIERFFGTLKPVLRSMRLTAGGLPTKLAGFASFYNEVRPHQNLGGLTPHEAWQGITWADVHRAQGRGAWVQACEGLLWGYRSRC
ncbi:integrase core domain-containing protein [Paracidovorax anthurii]|uniref:Integrase-like protein n=1 Tax=Paracidovorax anthurii TaxID=78229 RepID=A0A328YJF8_9BURK|nr:integrase core domain-containing protein [Paracidovorax anthurii]RAR70727.1 integrase-like protein [Paracidovorax anthurii]